MKDHIAAYATEYLEDNEIKLQIRIECNNLMLYKDIILVDDENFHMHISSVKKPEMH
jgi:hypothetical protein